MTHLRIKTETKKERNEDGPPPNSNGKTFKEYKDIANNFNTYFTNTNVRTSVNNLPTMVLYPQEFGIGS